jgi:hypothetical protein
LDAPLVQEPLKKVKILEPADGGGKKMTKKNVAYIILKNKKNTIYKVQQATCHT